MCTACGLRVHQACLRGGAANACLERIPPAALPSLLPCPQQVADCGVAKPGSGASATTAALQAPGAAAPRRAGRATALRAPGMAAQVAVQRRAALGGRAVVALRRARVAARAVAAAAPARALAVL